MVSTNPTPLKDPTGAYVDAVQQGISLDLILVAEALLPSLHVGRFVDVHGLGWVLD